MNATIETQQPEPMFQITLRHYTNRVTMEDGTWAEVNKFKNKMSVAAWEITREFNGRKVMVAQSTTYHPSVLPWMRNIKKLGAVVVDGLLVDVQLDRTYIHFSETPKQFDSNIKIYNGTHLSIEGNVTLENYDGFIKALELAKKSYMRKF